MKFRMQVVRVVSAIVVIYGLAMIPEGEYETGGGPKPDSGNGAFFWSRDEYWKSLEAEFRLARYGDRTKLLDTVDHRLGRLKALLSIGGKSAMGPSSPTFGELERQVFELGPLVAACPEKFPEYLGCVTNLRDFVKDQSLLWDMNDRITRSTMYRTMYGARAASEEIMLQMPTASVPEVVTGRDEPSATPWAAILGVPIHSGDILVSRGGAPTSALIARGSDYPGNFSHIALVHVEPRTSVVRILESHIERGVTISTLEEYVRDTKLRVMVLRLRTDHPAVASNPMLPHDAASWMLEEAGRQHFPYDFAMDQDDPSSLFCSEVASYAYRQHGVQLWQGMSTITSPGLRAWLSSLGVRNFRTQEPSDLEYDPQLRVVAEWRDPEMVSKDHIDNAVTEVMLEGAEEGDRLSVDAWMLPLARIMKTYSWLLNLAGAVGPVPEGMSASAALRSRCYTDRHTAISVILAPKVDSVTKSIGYRPPYWRLVELAREAERQVLP